MSAIQQNTDWLGDKALLFGHDPCHDLTPVILERVRIELRRGFDDKPDDHLDFMARRIVDAIFT